MVNLAGFAGFQHQADLGAQAFADEVMVQAGDGEQRRDRGVVLGDTSVGEDEDVDLVVLDGAAGEHTELLHGLGQALLTPGNAEENREDIDLEAGQLHAADFPEFLVGEDRPVELDAAAGGGAGLQQVALGTEAGLVGGDNFFADTVDRRVGHLGEQLLEIIVEQTRLVGENGKRGVVTHRADALDAVLGHGGKDRALVLVGVAEGELALVERVAVGGGQLGGGGQVVEVDEVLVEPGAVGEFGGELALDFLIGDDAALIGVHEEHLARLDTALFNDVGVRDVEHAGLGGEDDEVVLGDVVAGGAQAVAVENRADALAVGEGHGGRAVPRFH